jgi:hypothetical protein
VKRSRRSPNALHSRSDQDGIKLVLGSTEYILEKLRTSSNKERQISKTKKKRKGRKQKHTRSRDAPLDNAEFRSPETPLDHVQYCSRNFG